MTSIDDLFKKPNLPSSHVSVNGAKRKFEAPDAQEAYKSVKLVADADAKGGVNGDDQPDEEDDIEAGPELPPEDDVTDEEGRFFGGGVTRNTTDALDYLDTAEEEDLKEEKIDLAWVKRMVTTLERKINKNSEHRAKFEKQPEKFMGSEADLDAEVKGLSILSEHPEFYADFAKLEGSSHLVSLLAHDNTDIAINAIEIIAELIDEDVQAEQEQWDTLVDSMLDSDLVGLLASDLERFDETDNESDRQGVYHSLAVLEGLASQTTVAEKISHDAILEYLLRRVQVKENSIGQNKQYAAEVLQIILQAAPAARKRLVRLGGVDVLLKLLASYRKRDPEKDSYEGEYAENLFDALACVVDDFDAKKSFIDNEGMELMLIMLREGKFSKIRALKVIDYATSGQGAEIAERIVEAAGLKTIFGIFRKKTDRMITEHLLNIFSAMLRVLPGDSGARIRLLGKFVEKDYEKTERLVSLRREFASNLATIDEEIEGERKALSNENEEERSDLWLSRRLDGGLYCLETANVVLAWLVAEDVGAREVIAKLLKNHDESLTTIRTALENQREDAFRSKDQSSTEMLESLIECLK